jgi:hypothetical protein
VSPPNEILCIRPHKGEYQRRRGSTALPVKGWQNGLISFDWVRLDAPSMLIRKGDTTPAAVRRNSCHFRGWRIGWNEGRSVFSKKAAELSEIIMEINDLRRVARAPDRPEQDRWQF